MDPDRPITDPTRFAARRRRVLAGALATAVLATGGATVALADDGETAASSGQGTAPAVQTIQDEAQQERPQGADGEDCPEKDGSGSGSGASTEQGAPQTGTDTARSEV